MTYQHFPINYCFIQTFVASGKIRSVYINVYVNIFAEKSTTLPDNVHCRTHSLMSLPWGFCWQQAPCIGQKPRRSQCKYVMLIHSVCWPNIGVQTRCLEYITPWLFASTPICRLPKVLMVFSDGQFSLVISTIRRYRWIRGEAGAKGSCLNFFQSRPLKKRKQNVNIGIILVIGLHHELKYFVTLGPENAHIAPECQESTARFVIDGCHCWWDSASIL